MSSRLVDAMTLLLSAVQKADQSEAELLSMIEQARKYKCYGLLPRLCHHLETIRFARRRALAKIDQIREMDKHVV